MKKIIIILLLFITFANQSLLADEKSTKIDSLNFELLTSEAAKKAGICNELAQLYLEKFPGKTIKYGKHVLQLEEKTNEQVAIANFNIGEGYENLSNFSKSIEYYHDALKIYQELDDTLKIAHTLNSIGYIYYILNDYENANEYFEKSIALSLEINYYYGLARNYNHIGLINLVEKNYDEALQYFQKSMDYANEINNYDRITAAITNIGLVKAAQGKIDEALANFFKSLELNEKYTQNIWVIAECKNNIADLYIDKNEFKRTEQILVETEGLALSIKSKSIMNEINQLYAKLYEKKGNHQKSLEYYKKWITLKTEILSDNQLKRVAEIESSFKLENKEKEIELLKIESQLHEEKLKNSKSLLIFMNVLLLLSISAIATITILFLKRNSAYKHLVKKSEQIIEVERQRDKYKKQAAKNKKIKEETAFEDESGKYAGSALSDQQKKKLVKSILELMEKEKIYLDEHITSTSIAEKLGTNRSYLSQVINTYFGKRFSSFLNEYRVREAKIKFSDRENEKYTIEYIANSVGFHSVNAFNKAFKSDTGVTPSFYIKSLKEEKDRE